MFRRVSTELLAMQVKLDALLFENGRLAQANESLVADRDYWRERAEKLLDNALLRKGEVTAPVMAPATPKQVDPFTTLFRGLSHTEIETGKKGRIE